MCIKRSSGGLHPRAMQRTGHEARLSWIASAKNDGRRKEIRAYATAKVLEHEFNSFLYIYSLTRSCAFRRRGLHVPKTPMCPWVLPVKGASKAVAPIGPSNQMQPPDCTSALPTQSEFENGRLLSFTAPAWPRYIESKARFFFFLSHASFFASATLSIGHTFLLTLE